MANITAPRGTGDILPADSYKWRYAEGVIARIAEKYGFGEIRTPVFEHTELFNRSVGDTTDVVQKEMYTFTDKGNRSITLRPEGTAGAVRAVLEHGLANELLPLKLYYFTSCFRYEKPQAGRFRQFNQFGCEVFGAGSPYADADVIAFGAEIFAAFGIDVSLELNSIGCPECRERYNRAIYDYFKERDICGLCQTRIEQNPMRILDCKNPECREISANAPITLDYLCEECRSHFEQVKSALDTAGIAYKINPGIVRGLDYYTKTVFEFVTDIPGVQGTVCGGGRYDGLCSLLGGKPTAGLGFAMGFERIMILLDRIGYEFPPPQGCDIFFCNVDQNDLTAAFRLADMVKKTGISAEFNQCGRSLKAQMKYADKIGARYTCVVGESETEQGIYRIKNMQTGSVTEVTENNIIKEIAAI
ncbi:MAG: histidine--tRNA ligase [Oscillospiraceae bacterium]|nr:histidine--tRNA ligase [Oscillospiraceae bacterium]